MDRSAAAREKAAAKRAKAKKPPPPPPIKVVCITNPMKFKTTTSEFRSLVQKLTGQDSDTADIVSRYDRSHPEDDVCSAPDIAPANGTPTAAAANDQPARKFCPLELLEGAFDTQPQERIFPW